jgi:hypothetical protein
VWRGAAGVTVSAPGLTCDHLGAIAALYCVRTVVFEPDVAGTYTLVATAQDGCSAPVTTATPRIITANACPTPRLSILTPKTGACCCVSCYGEVCVVPALSPLLLQSTLLYDSTPLCSTVLYFLCPLLSSSVYHGPVHSCSAKYNVWPDVVNCCAPMQRLSPTPGRLECS